MMIDLWEELLARLGLKRAKVRRSFVFEESLHTKLVEQANLEQRPAEELLAELVATALAQRKTSGALKDRWQSLSPREQEVTALTCRGTENGI